MKKLLSLILITVILLAPMALSGCKSEEQNDMKTTTKKPETYVSVVNDLKEADIWILADTAENRKTTLWGEADAGDVNQYEKRRVTLCDPGYEGLYLFRMIDKDSFYYSADAVALKDGYTIRITGDDLHAKLLVFDTNSDVVKTYEVFSARL